MQKKDGTGLLPSKFEGHLAVEPEEAEGGADTPARDDPAKITMVTKPKADPIPSRESQATKLSQGQTDRA